MASGSLRQDSDFAILQYKYHKPATRTQVCLYRNRDYQYYLYKYKAKTDDAILFVSNCFCLEQFISPTINIV